MNLALMRMKVEGEIDVYNDKEVEVASTQPDTPIPGSSRADTPVPGTPRPDTPVPGTSKQDLNSSFCSNASSSASSVTGKLIAAGRCSRLTGEAITDMDEVVVGSYYEVNNGSKIEVVLVSEICENKVGIYYLECLGIIKGGPDKPVFRQKDFWYYDWNQFQTKLSDPLMFKRSAHRVYPYFKEIGPPDDL